MRAQHFKLKDWQKAFDCFDKWGADKVQLVLSTHPYTQGYWLEDRGVQVYDDLDFLYVGEEVYELRKRVEDALAKTIQHRGVIL